MRTTRMERTPRRRMDGTRHIARKLPWDSLFPPLQPWRRRKERLGVRMRGMRKDLLGRAFLDQVSQVHHCHAVSQIAHHTQIVGDEEIRHARSTLNLLEQIQNLRLNRDIQRTGAFVADNQPRLHRQCACQTDSLTLTAGKLVWIARRIRRIQSDLLQQLRYPCLAL